MLTMEGGRTHPFDRSGLAALSDLQTEEWRELFRTLEGQQREFLAKEEAFRSANYPWPRDPLHTWSRVWEYPYCYYQLRSWRASWTAQDKPRVVDVGSGVTFFPFSMARLGCYVTCSDTDPICDSDISRAAAVISHSPGIVDSRVTDGSSLPFRDAEVDVVTCISVLEHIPRFEETVSEIARILKPNGLLLVTIDLDLRGGAEIGTRRHRDLTAALDREFRLLWPETTVHPRNVLTTSNSPWPLQPSHVSLGWRLWETVRLVRGLKPRPLLPFCLAVQAFTLRRRPRQAP